MPWCSREGREGIGSLMGSEEGGEGERMEMMVWT